MLLKLISWHILTLALNSLMIGNVQEVHNPAIQTEYSHYFANTYTTLEIQTIYTNPFDQAVYLPGCRGITKDMQKLVDNKWIYIPRSHFACGTEPLPQVNPGGTLVDAFDINWDDIFLENPEFEIEGEYRIVWRIYAGLDVEREYADLDTLLPLEQRVSNTFRIEKL